MKDNKIYAFHKRSKEELNDFIKKLELQALETSEERIPLYNEIGLKNANLILDVGCGSGTVTRDIANYTKGKVVSVDGSKYMINVASKVLKNNRNIVLLISSAESLPFENNVFDIITCNLLLMWANNPQIVVNEMTRVVKPGGKVLASLEPDYICRKSNKKKRWRSTYRQKIKVIVCKSRIINKNWNRKQ